MKLTPCDIPGPMIIEPDVYHDSRGFFLESWSESEFAEQGLDLNFVQDNHSRSKHGVLRGLHFQSPSAQGKLIRVANGAIFDVAVDLRKSSPHFGGWISAELSDANKRMLWVPEGFAHGFLALQDGTDVIYKCTAPYSPKNQYCLAWDDPQVGIDWPIGSSQLIISDQDRAGKTLAELPHFS